jgi:L-asparaginase
MTLPRVAVVTTGGTIDSLGVDRLDLAAYLETGVRLEPGALLAGIAAELATVADVAEVPFRRLRAHAMTDDDLADLADGIRRLVGGGGAAAQAGGATLAGGVAAGGFDGVVVTHGTNTLEETAWLLQLVVATERPIVVTGAMRPASALSGDGPLNLVNAVRVAASEHARRLGVLVLLDDTIHGARDVAKSDTMRVHAFRDGAAGPLGWVDGDGRLTLAHLPARGWQLDGRFEHVDMRTLPRVDIVVTFQGADGALVDAAVAAGAKGIVSAGSGAGYPTDREVEALERASAAGIAVVQASRVGAGRVPPTPSLARRGWIAGGDLNPWKVRILLRLALADGITDTPALQALFDEA